MGASSQGSAEVPYRPQVTEQNLPHKVKRPSFWQKLDRAIQRGLTVAGTDAPNAIGTAFLKRSANKEGGGILEHRVVTSPALVEKRIAARREFMLTNGSVLGLKLIETDGQETKPLSLAGKEIPSDPKENARQQAMRDVAIATVQSAEKLARERVDAMYPRENAAKKMVRVTTMLREKIRPTVVFATQPDGAFSAQVFLFEGTAEQVTVNPQTGELSFFGDNEQGVALGKPEVARAHQATISYMPLKETDGSYMPNSDNLSTLQHASVNLLKKAKENNDARGISVDIGMHDQTSRLLAREMLTQSTDIMAVHSGLGHGRESQVLISPRYGVDTAGYVPDTIIATSLIGEATRLHLNTPGIIVIPTESSNSQEQLGMSVLETSGIKISGYKAEEAGAYHAEIAQRNETGKMSTMKVYVAQEAIDEWNALPTDALKNRYLVDKGATDKVDVLFQVPVNRELTTEEKTASDSMRKSFTKDTILYDYYASLLKRNLPIEPDTLTDPAVRLFSMNVDKFATISDANDELNRILDIVGNKSRDEALQAFSTELGIDLHDEQLNRLVNDMFASPSELAQIRSFDTTQLKGETRNEFVERALKELPSSTEPRIREAARMYLETQYAPEINTLLANIHGKDWRTMTKEQGMEQIRVLREQGRGNPQIEGALRMAEQILPEGDLKVSELTSARLDDMRHGEYKGLRALFAEAQPTSSTDGVSQLVDALRQLLAKPSQSNT